MGLINPITVRAVDGGYELIAGMNRLLAVQRLNARYIDATVLNADDLLADTVRLTENVARSNLSPVEEACQLHNLVEENPQGVDGVGTMIGRSPGWIQDRLEILSWPASLRQYVHEKKVSLAAAKRLSKIADPSVREERIHQAAVHGINARTASLWYQNSVAESAGRAENAPIATDGPVQEYTTETRVQCFVCLCPIVLERTRTMRVCEDCMVRVKRAQFESSGEGKGEGVAS